MEESEYAILAELNKSGGSLYAINSASTIPSVNFERKLICSSIISFGLLTLIELNDSGHKFCIRNKLK